MSSSEGRLSFVMSNAPPGIEIAGLANPASMEKTPFWWARIDMPGSNEGAINSQAGFQGDLLQDVDVVFTQNYEGVCDPSAEVPTICWLQEQYVAGEEGLKGTIAVARKQSQLEMYYSVDWQGLTDRFESDEPSWHHHITEGGGVAKIEEK